MQIFKEQLKNNKINKNRKINKQLKKFNLKNKFKAIKELIKKYKKDKLLMIQ